MQDFGPPMSALGPFSTGSGRLARCPLFPRIADSYQKRTTNIALTCRNQTQCTAAIRFAFYSITSSARASNIAGTPSPIAFAALRLITSSNLVGCSMANSPGFAPLRILST